MYEFHIAHTAEPRLRLTGDDLDRFAEVEGDYRAVSLTEWGEHCTECAWPDCYSSCDLYEARVDGHCRRFVHGMVPRPDVRTSTGCGVEIAFKRWGKLTATASTALVPISAARAITRSMRTLDGAADRARSVRIAGRDHAPVRLQGRLKRAVSRLDGSPVGRRLERTPDYFVVEVFSAEERLVPLSLVMRDADESRLDRPAYQQRLLVSPGFNRFRVQYERIADTVGSPERLGIDITPNINEPEEEGLTLVFGAVHFVAEHDWEPPKTVKAVIWDLDNTLWDGVLVEDGIDGIRLREEVADTIRALDDRGIVNSVSSKNTFEDAMAALAHFGLDHLFVFPEISWDPKSAGIARVIERLNVGPDTIVFVDDQEFERAEVAAAHPEVRTLDGGQRLNLLARTEFDPPVSAESRRRRQTYQDQEQREVALESSGGDYEAFLRDCEIVVRLDDAHRHAARVHELVQRTNQMNFSGHRYSREELSTLLSRDGTECFAIEVDDRFGAYGTVGFAAVDVGDGAPTVVDLAFSCRVQSKRVEHAVLAHLMGRYHARGDEQFRVAYRPTPKNAPSARVFEDLGFERLSDEDDTRILGYDISETAPSVDLLTVVDRT